MTAPTVKTDRYGRKATGIPPVVCAPWCKSRDGHIAAVMREDQTCWGETHYIDLELEPVEASLDDDDEYVIDLPRIGPCAYRGFHEEPCVYVHFYLPAGGADGIDASVRLTPAEAKALADYLTAVVAEIGVEE